jgi:hypothetical protein
MPKVKRLMFDIAGAKLLIEMVTVFLREEVRRENSVEHTKEIALRIKALIEAFSAVHTEVSTHLNEVVGAFPQILSIADEVSQGSRELSFVHVSGRIEAVQLPPGCSFASILDSMSTKIVQAEEQLVLLRRVCTQVQTGLGQCVPSLYSVDSYIGLMKGLMS